MAVGPRMLVGRARDRRDRRSWRRRSDPADARLPAARADRRRLQRCRECRAAVRYQIKYGADVIKFMPSGGAPTHEFPARVAARGGGSPFLRNLQRRLQRRRKLAGGGRS